MAKKENSSPKVKVITYGTFDLFHKGHRRLLKRAKKLGDYLIVGITTEHYDEGRGKLNVHQSLMERIENVKKSGLADEIIIEEYEGQKVNDILKKKVNIFAIGSDWVGKFDYLNEFCKVIYLERTKDISSTKIRNETSGIIELGVVGGGRIAKRFIAESKFVSGVDINSVFGRNKTRIQKFAKENEIANFSTSYNDFLKKVDAVYVATPHLTHYDFAKKALLAGKHVICEKPMTLNSHEAKELFELAKSKDLVLLEAIKTAFSPGFIRLLSVAKSGLIGHIKSVDATFTKLTPNGLREMRLEEAGGSLTELGSYPLLATVKLLGLDFLDVQFWSYYSGEKSVDLFTKVNIQYEHAIATLKTGLGVKAEGDMVIAGTNGYIYVPAPWWLTSYFEIRFEDQTQNKKYFYKYEGDGLRYELAEFTNMINRKQFETFKLTKDESLAITSIIDRHRKGINISRI